MTVKTYGGRFSMRLNCMPSTLPVPVDPPPGASARVRIPQLLCQGDTSWSVFANSCGIRSPFAAGEGGADGAGVLAEGGEVEVRVRAQLG